MSMYTCTCVHMSGLGFMERVWVAMWVYIKMFKSYGERV